MDLQITVMITNIYELGIILNILCAKHFTHVVHHHPLTNSLSSLVCDTVVCLINDGAGNTTEVSCELLHRTGYAQRERTLFSCGQKIHECLGQMRGAVLAGRRRATWLGGMPLSRQMQSRGCRPPQWSLVSVLPVFLKSRQD